MVVVVVRKAWLPFLVPNVQEIHNSRRGNKHDDGKPPKEPEKKAAGGAQRVALILINELCVRGVMIVQNNKLRMKQQRAVLLIYVVSQSTNQSQSV